MPMADMLKKLRAYYHLIKRHKKREEIEGPLGRTAQLSDIPAPQLIGRRSMADLVGQNI